MSVSHGKDKGKPKKKKNKKEIHQIESKVQLVGEPIPQKERDLGISLNSEIEPVHDDQRHYEMPKRTRIVLLPAGMVETNNIK